MVIPQTLQLDWNKDENKHRWNIPKGWVVALFRDNVSRSCIFVSLKKLHTNWLAITVQM